MPLAVQIENRLVRRHVVSQRGVVLFGRFCPHILDVLVAELFFDRRIFF
jgi:hypothetical protein